MKKNLIVRLLCFLILLNCRPLFSVELEGSHYEGKLISSGDNRPDFNANDELLKTLIVSLHRNISADSFQKTYGCTKAKYEELRDLLVRKQFVRQQGDRFLPTCMVIDEAGGKELFRQAQPISSDIAHALIADLDSIKGQYAQTEFSKVMDFDHASFFILSNVMLDNWQINNVESEFVKMERPLRHGKRYYFSLQQNLNSAAEAFGLYGNGGYPGFSAYGNNRNFSKRQILETRGSQMPVVSDKDDELFYAMASSFKPRLIAILEKYRSYGETVYRKTGYANEITHEEFFMWWYHFIYTKATDQLAEGKHLMIPPGGNFYYRSAN